MLRIGLILLVLVLLGIVLYSCFSPSTQTSQAPVPVMPQAPGPSAQVPVAPQSSGLFESSIPNITPSAKEPVRKSWLNMVIPDSRDPKYHDPQTTGKGIAERLPFGGITRTEPDRPWHQHQSVPDEEPQVAEEESTKPADPPPTPPPTPKHHSVPRDQEIIIYVPRCPQEQRAYHDHDCEHCPEHRRPPDYYSTRVPDERYHRRCNSHAFWDPSTGGCRCAGGGWEDRFGFCVYDHGDQRPTWARNYR